jgi:hypothetical protein
MKKNAMLKIAAILLVAVLLTTCAISATFAKYVTSAELDSQSARVAKWGVTVQVTGENVFKNEYGDVVAATEDVVAPGVKVEDGIVITTNGDAAEVDYKIMSDFKVELNGWGEYFPVVFTINGTDVTVTKTTPAEIATEVSKAINDAVAKLQTGNVSIGWYWDSNDDASATVDEIVADTTNKADTVLGNAGSATIAISGTVAAVQIATDYAS